MLEVDLHSHSHFSRCGLHSVVEMLTRAASLGMKGLAITDHGPELRGSLRSTLFERLHDPVSGIRFLKGVESNLRGDGGGIDLPVHLLRWTDIVLLGLHVNTPEGLGAERYTDMTIAALDKNPCVDIITHPDDLRYRQELERLAVAARTHGVALELNNSKTQLQRTDRLITLEMLRVCKKVGCSVAVCSDAHALGEVGRDEEVLPLLAETEFPEKLIVTTTAEKAFAFVERRRERKVSTP